MTQDLTRSGQCSRMTRNHSNTWGCRCKHMIKTTKRKTFRVISLASNFFIGSSLRVEGIVIPWPYILSHFSHNQHQNVWSDDCVWTKWQFYSSDLLLTFYNGKITWDLTSWIPNECPDLVTKASDRSDFYINKSDSRLVSLFSHKMLGLARIEHHLTTPLNADWFSSFM